MLQKLAGTVCWCPAKLHSFRITELLQLRRCLNLRVVLLDPLQP